LHDKRGTRGKRGRSSFVPDGRENFIGRRRTLMGWERRALTYAILLPPTLLLIFGGIKVF
jgi:hypothetical protein